MLIEDQISEITEGIDEVKHNNGERFTIKELTRAKKQLEANLEKLMANYKKDDVVTFEELGVDMMFVDESDMYKNLFLYTKMRNVAGLSTANAQKSSDMFAKCRYLDEITGGRGVVFATGTPVHTPYLRLNTELNFDPVLVRNVHDVYHRDGQSVLLVHSKGIPSAHRVSQGSGVDLLVFSDLCP